MSTKDPLRGQTEILIVCRIARINCHPVEHCENGSPDSIADTHDWLDWIGDVVNPNDCEDGCMAHVESDIDQEHRIKDPVCTEQRDVCAAPNIPTLIRPTWRSKKSA